MRNIYLNNIKFDNKNAQYFCFCFKITTTEKQEMYFTSHNNTKKIDNNIYSHYSGLSIKNSYFNDSAENVIIVHGIFETKGITKTHNITGSKFDIYICYQNNIEHYVTMYCTEFVHHDLEFQIKLESEAIKYKKTLLKTFSKTCRAKFGDNKCKIDVNSYSKGSIIINIISLTSITIENIDIQDHYFDYGKCVITLNNGKKLEYRIKNQIQKHNGQHITFYTKIDEQCLITNKVTLIPTCDKTYFSCNKNFNNVINFRGEPFIPSTTLIKN